MEKAGEPWITAQGRLVSNYDAGSPGSSVGFIICQFQCFGSGWNRIALALLNPDPYRKCGSGLSKWLLYRYLCFMTYRITYIK